MSYGLSSCNEHFNLHSFDISSVSSSSAPLAGGMTKKKRKSDPGMDKAKDERRTKRLLKALKQMNKKQRQPKPLMECEVPLLLHQVHHHQ